MAQSLAKTLATKRRWRRKAVTKASKEGLCVDCLKQPRAAGVTRCQPCREAFNARARKRNARILNAKRKLGICLRCENAAMPGRKFCGYHSERAQEVQTAARRRARAEGRCGSCEQERDDPAYLVCSRCRAAHRQQYHRRKATQKRHGAGVRALPMANLQESA